MCMCRPSSSRRSEAGHALDRRRRVVEVEAELRVRAAGRDRRVRVGADRRARSASAPSGARRGATISSRRSMSLLVVEHDVADAGVVRGLQLGARLGVAVQVDARRVEAGRAARACSSPPPATSQARPSSAMQRAGPPCTGTPWPRSATSKSSRARARRPPRRRARGRGCRPRRRRRPACRTRARARARRSRRSRGGRPR